MFSQPSVSHTLPETIYCTTAAETFNVILAYYAAYKEEKSTDTKAKKHAALLNECEQLESSLKYSGNALDQSVLLQCHVLQSNLLLQNEEYRTAYQYYGKARVIYQDHKVLAILDGDKRPNIDSLNAYSKLGAFLFKLSEKKPDLFHHDDQVECETNVLATRNAKMLDSTGDNRLIKQTAACFVIAMKQMLCGNSSAMITLYESTCYTCNWTSDHLYLFAVAYRLKLKEFFHTTDLKTELNSLNHPLKKGLIESHKDQYFNTTKRFMSTLFLCYNENNFKALSISDRLCIIGYLAEMTEFFISECTRHPTPHSVDISLNKSKEGFSLFIKGTLDMWVKYEYEWGTSPVVSFISVFAGLELQSLYKKKQVRSDDLSHLNEKQFIQQIIKNIASHEKLEVILLQAICKFTKQTDFYGYLTLCYANQIKSNHALIEKTLLWLQLTLHTHHALYSANKKWPPIDANFIEQFDFIYAHLKKDRPRSLRAYLRQSVSTQKSQNEPTLIQKNILAKLCFQAKKQDKTEQKISLSSTSDIIQKMIAETELNAMAYCSLPTKTNRTTIRIPISSTRHEEKERNKNTLSSSSSASPSTPIVIKKKNEKTKQLTEQKKHVVNHLIPVAEFDFPKAFSSPFESSIPSIKKIAELFRLAGKKLYLVGSAIESLQKNKAHEGDYDFVTDAAPDEVNKILGSYGIVQNKWNNRLFKFSALSKMTNSIDIYCSEKLANASSDSPELDDANSRDFIQKSMLASLNDKNLKIKVFDPTQRGFDAIKNDRPLDTIAPAKEIFKKDPKVMLRAIKYESTTGLSQDILNAIPECKALLHADQTANEVTIWLGHLLCKGKGEHAFSRLIELGLMQAIFPKINFNKKICPTLIALLKWMDETAAQQQLPSSSSVCKYIGIQCLTMPPFLIYVFYAYLLVQAARRTQKNYSLAVAHAEMLIEQTPCLNQAIKTYPNNNLLDVVKYKLYELYHLALRPHVNQGLSFSSSSPRPSP